MKIFILILSIVGVNCFSLLESRGQDVEISGSGYDTDDTSGDVTSTTHTVLHEITGTLATTIDYSGIDVTKYQTSGNDVTNNNNENSHKATEDPSCIGGACGITIAPMPTQIMNIDLDDDVTTPIMQSEDNTICSEVKVQLEKIEISRMLQNEKYFTKILKVLQNLENQNQEKNIFEKTEKLFEEKFLIIEKKFNQIFKSLDETKDNVKTIVQNTKFDSKSKSTPTTSPTKPTQLTTPGVEISKIQEVDTDYIDFKFDEMWNKMSEVNNVIERNLENNIKSILEKFGAEKKQDAIQVTTTAQPTASETDTKNRNEYPKIMMCKSCCEEVPLSVLLKSQKEQGTRDPLDLRPIEYGKLSELRIESRSESYQDEFDIDQTHENTTSSKNENVTKTTVASNMKSNPWQITVAPSQTPSTTTATTIPLPVVDTKTTTSSLQTSTMPTESYESSSLTIEDVTGNKSKASEMKTTTFFKFLAKLHENLNQDEQNNSSGNESTLIERTGKAPKAKIEAGEVASTSDRTASLKLTAKSTPKPSKHDLPKHCADIYIRGQRRSGVYRISPLGRGSWKAYCDMQTDGGGWTVIQRRSVGDVNFTKNWEEYKKGFGNLDGDYWLGLDRMNMLTSTARRRPRTSLRINLTDWSDVSQYAQYNTFKVGNAEKNYRILVKQYHGTAGNALQYGESYNHNLQGFTTLDNDNDGYTQGNCGDYYQSGWWFNACFAANLNGKYYKGTYHGIQNGIYWGTWYRLNDAETSARHSFKYVDMKVRPTNFIATMRRQKS